MAGESNILRASWGVSPDNANLEIEGVVTSVSSRREGQTYTEQDALGAVDGVFMFDFTESLSVDVLVGTTVDKPAVGDVFVCGDFAGWVKSAEVVETNSSYRRIHVDAEATMLCLELGEIDPENGAGIDASGGTGLDWNGDVTGE